MTSSILSKKLIRLACDNAEKAREAEETGKLSQIAYFRGLRVAYWHSAREIMLNEGCVESTVDMWCGKEPPTV